MLPNKKNKTGVILRNDETLEERAQQFNTFFASVGKHTFENAQHYVKDNGGILKTVQTDVIDSAFMFRPKPVDSATIVLTIKRMKNTNSYGSDEVPLRFIKDSLPIVIPYLTCIINTCTGIVPAAWKHSIVVPIHKSGDDDLASNYRPISLLSMLSKVLEKVIAKQLLEHLESNSVLSNTQHGFRSTLSTNTALLTV